MGILDKGFGTRDNETNTDEPPVQVKLNGDDDEDKKKTRKM